MGQRQGGLPIGSGQHTQASAFQIIAHQLDNFWFIINNKNVS